MSTVDQLVDIVKAWSVDRRIVVLVGPPGCGKSYSIKEVANRLGLSVSEIDANSINNRVLKTLLSKPINPTVYVIDGIEALPRRVIDKIIAEYPNPTFATTTDYVLASKLEGRCRVVRMFRPKVAELKKVADAESKKLGLKVNYEALSSGDYRQALLSVYGSQGYDQEAGRIRELADMMKKGVYDYLDSRDAITVLDSLQFNYYGIELIMFVKHLAVYDVCKRPVVLNGLKVENPKVYQSYFFEKLRLSGGRMYT